MVIYPLPSLHNPHQLILIVQNTAEDLFNSGLAKSEAGDIRGCDPESTAAIRLNPNYVQAYNKLGIIRARNLKDYPAAKADFDRAIEINPNYGDAYYNRARVREFLEDKNGAIVDYHKAAELYKKMAIPTIIKMLSSILKCCKNKWLLKT